MRDRPSNCFTERPLTATESVELPVTFEDRGDVCFASAELMFSAVDEIDICTARILIAKKRGLGESLVVRLSEEPWNRYYRFDGSEWLIGVCREQPTQNRNRKMIKLIVIVITIAATVSFIRY